MARPTHDIVASLGEYTATDGTKKKRYHTCGKAFTNDKGQMSLKIDAMPCGQEWSGWLSLYPVQDQARQDPRPVQKSLPPAPPAGEPEEDDEIPF